MTLFKSTKKTRIVGAALLLLFTTTLWARPIAFVNSVSGKAFYVFSGKMKMIQAGTHIPNGSEIITETGAQVDYSDYFDHRYHLSGSGHVLVKENYTKLYSGYFWLQSFRKDSEAEIFTANAKVKYLNGDAIVSFDSVSGKTQLLVISGDFSFANIEQPDRGVNLFDGQFSFVTNDSKESSQNVPRNPTNCGFDSFKRITQLFDDVDPIHKESFRKMANAPSVNRKIASVTNTNQMREIPLDNDHKNGTLTIRSRHTGTRSPASVGGSKSNFLNSLYKTKLNKFKYYDMKRKSLDQKREVYTPSNVAVKIFGKTYNTKTKVKWKKNEKKKQIAATPKILNESSKRAPASMTSVRMNPAFKKSVLKEFDQQLRHKDEVNQLIDELKSYNQDYEKKY